MIPVLVITGIMCVCLIAAILIKPNIQISKISIGTYWIVALIGAIILLCTGCISLKQVGEGLIVKTSINPIKILVLFLSMTIQSIFLDEIGLFRLCANLALKNAKGSQTMLFVSLYTIVSILTVFTSNDIIILTFTPFICYFAKNAKINPVPYLFTEFVAANTWSMALIIGNPTNVYLASINGIDFLHYTSKMIIPTVMAGLSAMGVLYIVFKKQFDKPIEAEPEEYHIEDKGLLIIGVAHLALCTGLLIASSYIGFEMWLITLGFALSLFVVSGIYMAIKKIKPVVLGKCLQRAPWELVPFVISMFVVVLSFDNCGISTRIQELLGESHTIIKYGLASFLSANLVNNIPMSVLFSSVVKGVSNSNSLKAIYASIIGSNIGAFFTPIGALAGIMWTGILKKHNVEFKFKTYVKYGAIISIPTLAAALLGLWIVLKKG